MEKKMKKNKLILFSILLLSNTVLATEDFLPDIIKKDQALRPYVKSVISSSELPKKVELFSSIESPSSFKQLDFKELLQGMFGEKVWTPHIHKFKNILLQEALQPYSPKLSDSEVEMVFLANILYSAGSMLYDETKHYTHLEHAASLGHSDAQLKMFSVDFKLGRLEEAKNYLFCSAAQGNLQALNKLSSVYEGYWGIGVPKNLDMAKFICQEASDLGDPEAQFMINVASFTEGAFGSEKNFQQGVRNAKNLADSGNQRAIEFLEGIMMSSADALQEADDELTGEDLNFLRSFLKWKDEWDK